MCSIVYLVVLPALLLPVLLPASAERSFYGESCNKTIKCDSGAWLGCFEGVCGCLKQNEMLYDESTSKCVSKAGERCRYAVEENDDELGDSSASSSLIFEVTNCVPNATCSPEGICACDHRFHENVTGLCTSSQSHLESCDLEHKCSFYEALECEEGICRCNISTSDYSTQESQCIGLGNQACVNSKCIENAFCHNNLCRCNPGFFLEEATQRCHPKMEPLQNCTQTHQCESKPGLEMMCVDGICNCNPDISMYATVQKADRYRFNPDIFNGFIGGPVTKCVGLAGSKCLDRLCAPRAYCSYNFATDFSGICKCLSGFKQTKLGRCGHDYLESCDSGDSCIDGLVCNNKRCLCKYSNQEYDVMVKKCISKVGGPCNKTIPCNSKAICKPVFPNNPDSPGHCQCQEGYVENLAGGCDVAYGGSCDSSGDCDAIASLQCVNSICQCGSFAEFSHPDRKCLGLIGAKCDINTSILEKECIENAHCAQFHPKLPGVCTCDHQRNFTETEDYHCRA